MAAVNDIGTGLYSTPISFIAAEVPSQPRSVAKLSADSTQISIQWLIPSQNGGSPVINYKVYKDSVEITPAEGTSGATQWTTSDVSAGV